MKNFYTCFKPIAIASMGLCSLLDCPAQIPPALPNPIAAQATLPYEPGQYVWPFSGGQFILLSARYTNQVSWDVRQYSFYVKTADNFYSVPLESADKKSDTPTLTTVSRSGADWLMDDILIKTAQKRIYLIKGSQATPQGYAEPGDLTLAVYELKIAKQEDIPYTFKLLRSKTLKNAPRVGIDEALRKEAETIK